MRAHCALDCGCQGYRHIPSALARQHDVGTTDANIQVVGANLNGDCALRLAHVMHRSVPLHEATREPVRGHLERFLGARSRGRGDGRSEPALCGNSKNRSKHLSAARSLHFRAHVFPEGGESKEDLMRLKQACLAAAIALLPLAAAAPASAVVVAVGVGVPAPGHYCGWHHRCWAYHSNGGYYNYYWHGRYWNHRYACAHRWCYR